MKLVIDQESGEELEIQNDLHERDHHCNPLFRKGSYVPAEVKPGTSIHIALSRWPVSRLAQRLFSTQKPC